MQKESIINKLKESGCRITKQRLLMLDIILENDCSCCKEIYYKASKADDAIGLATVYRFLNTLEELGAISRNSTYQLPSCSENCMLSNPCKVMLDDNSVHTLTAEEFSEVIKAGLSAQGYIDNQDVVSVVPEK
ncbi:MAG: transcriptional repressor [bacterium]|nr:transcriptional repressor [bacterium]